MQSPTLAPARATGPQQWPLQKASQWFRISSVESRIKANRFKKWRGKYACKKDLCVFVGWDEGQIYWANLHWAIQYSHWVILQLGSPGLRVCLSAPLQSPKSLKKSAPSQRRSRMERSSPLENKSSMSPSRSRLQQNIRTKNAPGTTEKRNHSAILL